MWELLLRMFKKRKPIFYLLGLAFTVYDWYSDNWLISTAHKSGRATAELLSTILFETGVLISWQAVLIYPFLIWQHFRGNSDDNEWEKELQSEGARCGLLHAVFGTLPQMFIYMWMIPPSENSGLLQILAYLGSLTFGVVCYFATTNVNISNLAMVLSEGLEVLIYASVLEIHRFHPESIQWVRQSKTILLPHSYINFNLSSSHFASRVFILLMGVHSGMKTFLLTKLHTCYLFVFDCQLTIQTIEIEVIRLARYLITLNMLVFLFFLSFFGDNRTSWLTYGYGILIFLFTFLMCCRNPRLISLYAYIAVFHHAIVLITTPAFVSDIRFLLFSCFVAMIYTIAAVSFALERSFPTIPSWE